MSSDTSFYAAQAKSTATFLSALILSASVAGIQVAAFLILRTSIRKIYAPRTYLPVPSKRSQPVSTTPWGWLLPTIKTPSSSMIPTAGLDAYMYLRFLKLMIFIFAPASCLVSPILLPLDSVGTKISSAGLSSFAFGNITSDQQIRYVGHLICAYVLTIWAVFLIQREMSNYIRLRQEYLISQRYLELPQSRTVLVTGVPKKYLSIKALRQLTAHLPGGIKQVWLSRELKNLPDLYNQRLKCTLMLESAETKLCKAAVKHNRKPRKLVFPTHQAGQVTPSQHLSQPSIKDKCQAHQELVDELVLRKYRPTHRLGFLGLMGKKVDTIDWCKDEIIRLTDQLKQARRQLQNHPPHNSAFIEFNERLAAQIFSQIVLYQKPLRMAKRSIDVAPEDVIWDNLNINPYDERIRNMISWVFTIALVILWSFPVAFIGSLSNISSLCTTVKWLSWVCHTNAHLQDIVQGTLPPVLLALIFLILPMILRLIGRYSGVARISEIELILMTRYYIFLVIHGFIVTTLSSGLTAAIPALSKDPSQAVTILTVNLPKASIFFMTYIITTSLTTSSGALLQIFTLIIYYFRLFVFASTPRSVFNVRYEMAQPQFGTLFPNTTLLATIVLAYSIIAPIMSILGLFAFVIYWIVYKYLFLFVFDVPAAHETGGRFFPLAINHVYVGLYFCQLCLTGLFFLARNPQGDPSSIAEGAMMVILLFITFFSHVLLLNSFTPLTMFVPLSMIEEEIGSKNLDISMQPLMGANEDQRSRLNSFVSSSRGKWLKNFEEEGDQESASAKVTATGTQGQKSNLGPIGENIGTHAGCSNDNTRPQLQNVNFQSSNSGIEGVFPERGHTAFLHPAVWEQTRPIWIPEDPVGVAKLEVADMKAKKIAASIEGASITNSRTVYVTRSPPENAEVIELERTKTQGIFAIPGAIGEAARVAGELISEKVGGSTRLTKANHVRKPSDSSALKNSEMMSLSNSRKGLHSGDNLKFTLKGKKKKYEKNIKDSFESEKEEFENGRPSNIENESTDEMKGKSFRSVETITEDDSTTTLKEDKTELTNLGNDFLTGSSIE
ncbi:hypothetical protein O181_003650 [Austropuccinia psidii MF-1]|uniref:DUF221-domain-containing protein n=1 Tax=Austropuccinia psidii MF-1 TaxID=1389203 RepID=A0A9Q3BFE8_9BASI|nr:hypothetical protein [Austropuccinia psidii MF-1]